MKKLFFVYGIKTETNINLPRFKDISKEKLRVPIQAEDTRGVVAEIATQLVSAIESGEIIARSIPGTHNDDDGIAKYCRYWSLEGNRQIDGHPVGVLQEIIRPKVDYMVNSLLSDTSNGVVYLKSMAQT